VSPQQIQSIAGELLQARALPAISGLPLQNLTISYTG
jgi:hypothetical protein